MSLTDLFQFLAAAKVGHTQIRSGQDHQTDVYFKNGTIVGSKSNDPREYLGQVLFHYGKV